MVTLRRRDMLLMLALASACVYAVNKYFIRHVPEGQYDVPAANVFVFKDLAGNVPASVVPPRPPAPHWQQYYVPGNSGLCIFLTDTQSHWLGLVHGLKGMGIPFTITNDIDEAVKHKVVMAYPAVSGKLLGQHQLQSLAAVPRNGGTLIAFNVYGGGFEEVFSYTNLDANTHHNKIKLAGTGNDALKEAFADVIDGELILSDDSATTGFATAGYAGCKIPLMAFDDGSACLAYKDYGAGKAYAFGIDLGHYFEQNMNARGFDTRRAYVNRYEANIDVFLRVLKALYTAGDPDAVIIQPAPQAKAFTMIMTHDIDFTRSIVNTAPYADAEQELGIKATYFIQTKYVKDWNDDIFFNDANVQYIKRLAGMGMEVASHSVAHSKVFSKFPLGSGNEQYPAYQPFVKERYVTYNGTVLGELRVSKYLLEHFSGKEVTSFRPGHLQYPFALPQAMVATGYRYSSAVTAGNAQTNLPYLHLYNREAGGETGTLEIPVAVEDEAGLPMLQRLDSAQAYADVLAKYGGVFVALIHTDITGQKLEFEKKLVAANKGRAWMPTIGEFGDWWMARNKVTVTATGNGSARHIMVRNPGGPLKGLTLQVPAGWRLGSGAKAAQNGTSVIIPDLAGDVDLTFSVR